MDKNKSDEKFGRESFNPLLGIDSIELAKSSKNRVSFDELGINSFKNAKIHREKSQNR